MDRVVIIGDFESEMKYCFFFWRIGDLESDRETLRFEILRMKISSVRRAPLWKE